LRLEENRCIGNQIGVGTIQIERVRSGSSESAAVPSERVLLWLSKEVSPVLVNRAGLVALLRRPALWGAAASTILSLAPAGWWKRPPFLPIPDEELVTWRLTTAYGTAETTLDEDDLVAYLEWRQQTARGSGGSN
jgi:hypothetical protein